jgi:hypothetical protein
MFCISFCMINRYEDTQSVITVYTLEVLSPEVHVTLHYSRGTINTMYMNLSVICSLILKQKGEPKISHFISKQMI